MPSEIERLLPTSPARLLLMLMPLRAIRTFRHADADARCHDVAAYAAAICAYAPRYFARRLIRYMFVAMPLL